MYRKPFLTLAIALGLAGSAFAQEHASHLQGIEYYKADQLDNAKEILLRNFENPESDKALANYYLGRIALDNGNQAEAKKYFDAGIAANPDCAYNYVGLAAIQLKNKETKAAEENIKIAEKLGKKDAELFIAIAEAYYDADPVGYLKTYTKYDEKARKINMKEPAIYLFEGNQWRAKNDIGQAAQNYDMAINYDPQATGAYVKYANLYRKVNPNERIKQLENLVAANPTSAIGQKELAEAYYDYAERLTEEGSKSQAADLYAKAAEQYGKYVQNPNHFKRDEDRYALLLFSGGEYQKGYDFATQLLKSNPDNFTAKRFQFFNAANIPAYKDQLLGIAEGIYTAHKANPTENKMAPLDYNLIADVYSENGRAEDAIAILQEGLANKDLKNINYFYKTIAQNYITLEQYDKAAQAYADYIENAEKPTYAENLTGAIYAYYGALEQKKNAPEQAPATFELAKKLALQAAEMIPDQYRPYKVLGDIAIAQAASEADAKNAAVEAYSKGVALYEANPDESRKADAINMYNYLGNYYLDRKDKDSAKPYFVKASNLQPEDEKYRQFVNSL